MSDLTEVIRRLERLELMSQVGTSVTSTSSPFQPTNTVTKQIQKFVQMPKQVQTVLTAQMDSENPQELSQVPVPQPSSKATTHTRLPSIPLPTFDGTEFTLFLKGFRRWMRLSGVEEAAEETKADWLIEACAPRVRRLVTTLVEQNEGNFIGVLQAMEKLYPELENDISIRQKLDSVNPLPHNPDPDLVATLFLELTELLERLTPGCISDQEKLLLLLKDPPQNLVRIEGRSILENKDQRF
jgi:hypothetical protein